MCFFFFFDAIAGVFHLWNRGISQFCAGDLQQHISKSSELAGDDEYRLREVSNRDVIDQSVGAPWD